MKEEIRFRCGHIEELELPNNAKARHSMKQHMEEHGCRACDYQEKVEVATRRTAELGLIALRGTSKQVAYGNLLRSRQVDLFLHTVELARRADPEGQGAELLQRLLLSTVNTLPNAAWWIEHQSLRSLQSLLPKQWGEELDDE